MAKIIPLLLAGGAGTRLWPVSRDALPKQFLPLVGARSTYQDTLLRVADKALFGDPIVITGSDYRFFAQRQAEEIGMALSWSGETEELRSLIDYSRRFKIGLVAVTAEAASTLGKAADVALVLPHAREACPHNLAPTTSSLMQLGLGDALAIALLESRGFTAVDFGLLHPAGRLGALLKFARDVMHRDAAVPLVHALYERPRTSSAATAGATSRSRLEIPRPARKPVLAITPASFCSLSESLVRSASECHRCSTPVA